MFTHFIRSAMRNLLKYKQFSALNILGLSTGLAAAILIMLFVKDELSYDQFWSDVDQKYRIQITFKPSGREPMSFSSGPGPLKEALTTYFPEDVLLSTRVNPRRPTLKIGDDSYLDRVPYVDPEVIDIFDFTTLAGDLSLAVEGANSMALSRERAVKYFGSVEGAIGQTVNLTFAGVVKDYQVAAVFEDFPENSHIEMPAMVKIIEEDFANTPWFFSSWFSANNLVYFQLKDGRSIDIINNQMTNFINGVGIDSGDGSNPSDFLDFTTYNMGDIHLYNKAQGSSGGDIRLIYAFMMIAGLVLVIASINFMNLSTAQASLRAREVSLRKVLGANKSNLIGQFVGESVLLTIVALVIGVAISYLLLPAYNQLLDRAIVLDLTDVSIAAMILTMGLVLGTAGGLYPAFVLSAYRPSEILRANKSADTGGSSVVRNVLVTFQFCISIGLIIATSVVYLQLSFFRTLDRGYDPDRMMVVSGMGDDIAGDRRYALKVEVMKLPFVESATITSEGPSNANENNTSLSLPGSDQTQLVGRVDVDHDFLETYNLSLIAGRDFSRDYAEDKQPTVDEGRNQANVLINETAVRKLGFSSPEDALSKQVNMPWRRGDAGNLLYIEQTIVGVINDAHFHSLKNVLRPELYLIGDIEFDLVVRFNNDFESANAEIQRVWQNIIPDMPYNSFQAASAIAREFDAEVRQTNIFAAFSVLAILISCLGLFGLASFVASRRTKEIGLRKVMGANVKDILRLMIWQFSKPVFVSALIIVPLISWVMIDWLENFPYRMDSLLIMPLALVAVGIALFIAWATVMSHTINVAKTKPITALRYE